MSKCDEFRQYAEEAVLAASRSKKEREKKALVDLAHVWAIAAFEMERRGECCAPSVQPGSKPMPNPSNLAEGNHVA